MSEFIDDVQSRICDALIRLGVSGEVAGLVGAEITSDLLRTWSGERVYIAKKPYSVAKLHDEIRRKFNGRNAHEIAREMEIGRATVYRIIKTEGR